MLNHRGFQISFSVSERQLITPIEILPAHLQGEQPSPFPGSFKALWDTGATNSTISTSLAIRFGLDAIRDSYAHGVGGRYKTKVYLAGLCLPNDIIIPELSLSGFDAPPEFDIIIGMDIISLGDFLVSTVKGFIHFSFQLPSIGGITLRGIQQAICYDGSQVTTNSNIKNGNNPNIGRNAPCPCGSGKKYKKCCGQK